MRSAIFLLSFTAIACAFSAEAAPTARGRAATKAEIEVIRESLQERLKDADSAKFKDVYFGTGGEKNTVCGLVNSKNSYGGYAGYSTFVGMLFKGSDTKDGKPVAIVLGVDSEEGGVAATMCAKHGIN